MLNMSTVIEQKTAYSKTLYLKWVKSFWREMIETEIDSGCFILFSCFFLDGCRWFFQSYEPPCILHLPGLLVSGEVNNFQEKEVWVLQGSYSLSYFLTVFTKVCCRLLTLAKISSVIL